MASLDSLSDGEIRVKLTELGYPVGPITATTRKVLLKKLKHLLDQLKSPGSDKKDVKNRSSLSRYSSEEESEDDVTASTRSRRSMPPPPPKSPPKTVKRRSLGRRLPEETLEDNTDTSEFHYPSASSTFNSEIVTGSQNHKYSPKTFLSSNFGDSDSPGNINRGTFSSFSSNYQSKYLSRKSQEHFDTGSDTDGVDELESKIHRSPPKTTSPSSYSFIPSLSGGFSQTRSRFQPQTNSNANDGSRFSGKSGSSNDSNSHSSPFSSDFVKRLAAASQNRSGVNAGLPSRLLDVKESDDEDVNSSPAYSNYNTGNIRSKTTSSLEGKIWRNASTISMVLLFVVGVFFCGLAVVYLNVRFKEIPMTSTDTNLPLCKLGEKPGATCVLSTEVKPAMDMFKELYHVLNDRAVQYACGSGLETSALAEDQMTQLLVEKSAVSLWDIEKHLGNIKVLIRANPQWGVEVNGDKFNIPSPNLPLGCYVLSLFYGIMGSALRLIVVLGALLGAGRAVYWWIDRQERNKKEVFRMVESIIDILSSHQQSSAGDNYLAISHVRDQLIPPQQRDKMASVWNKAVAYLEENESRVRTEVQQVLGEEFRVWRWLPAPRSNGKRKVWQGQAFETMEGSVNSLPVSPTPCLKIRHMFDSDVEVGEDWIIRVQDAILEKCEGVNVLHVAVDKNSNEGCVYVKCASPQDAGRAYRALHGSWFDSKLVTVKYLRLERYHERFPDSARSLRPLRPSNDRKLSLQ
ncbi:inner nuclear membrane protein Man1 [Homalodisca vitripennis]|nr:inner nuclear membrane protein Man1 [Homalodisca vitripennis]